MAEREQAEIARAANRILTEQVSANETAIALQNKAFGVITQNVTKAGHREEALTRDNGSLRAEANRLEGLLAVERKMHASVAKELETAKEAVSKSLPDAGKPDGSEQRNAYLEKLRGIGLTKHYFGSQDTALAAENATLRAEIERSFAQAQTQSGKHSAVAPERVADFYIFKPTVKGPYTAAFVRAQITSNLVEPLTPLWDQKTKEWRPAKLVAEFASMFPNAPGSEVQRL